MYTINVVISRKRCQLESLLVTSNKKWYTAYRIEAIPITLSHLEGHSLYCKAFKCDFLYSCAADDKIPTDIASRAVPSCASCWDMQEDTQTDEHIHANCSTSHPYRGEWKQRRAKMPTQIDDQSVADDVCQTEKMLLSIMKPSMRPTVAKTVNRSYDSCCPPCVRSLATSPFSRRVPRHKGRSRQQSSWL